MVPPCFRLAVQHALFVWKGQIIPLAGYGAFRLTLRALESSAQLLEQDILSSVTGDIPKEY
ncbi:hypothetical protein KDH_33570 [Dictyobacter sp. S3.2.2.5]|uniref:Uncharacterized protein n=1 Tax=Dictyobacter halimunensis TaxID=3026934 RepID=A0ABQ6FSE5_9CHLR|nr:hypothetical protein KDH_33570 [Dictyobacter sp. S3.2.2.5]